MTPIILVLGLAMLGEPPADANHAEAPQGIDGTETARATDETGSDDGADTRTPVRRAKRDDSSPPDPLDESSTAPWLSQTFVGGGACMAAGTTALATYCLASVIGCIPFVGQFVGLAYCCTLPWVLSGVITSTAYVLNHQVARRRAPLLPLALSTTGIVLAGFTGAILATMAAVVLVFPLNILDFSGAPTGPNMPPAVRIVFMIVFGVLGISYFLLATSWILLLGSLGTASAVSAILGGVMGRPMTPQEDGFHVDVVSVADPDPDDE